MDAATASRGLEVVQTTKHGGRTACPGCSTPSLSLCSMLSLLCDQGIRRQLGDLAPGGVVPRTASARPLATCACRCLVPAHRPAGSGRRDQPKAYEPLLLSACRCLPPPMQPCGAASPTCRPSRPRTCRVRTARANENARPGLRRPSSGADANGRAYVHPALPAGRRNNAARGEAARGEPRAGTWKAASESMLRTSFLSGGFPRD